MADPKYAGLPGIVYDQPDIYETSDLPESEQEFCDASSDLADSHPDFEVLHLSASNSHEKFKGKYLNTSNVDFSDSLSKRNRTGYLSRPIEWSIRGHSGDETVVEKYQRIKAELSELQEEVKDLKDTIKHGEGNASAVDLVKDVDTLRCALSDLNLERSLGTELMSSLSNPEIAVQRKLVNLIDKLKNIDSTPGSKKRSGHGGSGSTGNPPDSGSPENTGPGLRYELFYAPEHAKLSEAAQVAQIEKKLDRLEALIGRDSDQLSSLSSLTNHHSLLDSVRVLSARMALLEPNHLDHIEGRLHAVHTRMNAISEKKGSIADDAEKRAKVDALYEIAKKNDAMFALVPDIVDRLTSLETLHQEGNRFNDSIKQLNAAQSQLSATLDSNASLLKEVQKKFLQNFTVIQENIKMLDERLNKLQQKTKK